MLPRPCAIKIPEGGQLVCYFHCWTRQAGELRAVIEQSDGKMVYVDPLEVKFKEAPPKKELACG